VSKRAGLVGVGDNVVDCYPDLARMFPGGNALNVAVHASRASVPAAYLGVIGDDDAGRQIRAALLSERISTERLRVARGPSARAVVRLVDGDRVFESADKGVSLFSVDDADLAYISQFELAHSSYASRLEAQLPDIGAATRLSFDFGNRRSPAYAAPLLPHVYMAEFSASDLSDLEIEELARWALDLGPRHVLVTMGARGATLFSGGRVHRQSSVPAKTIDTLGAGDAFIGRTLVGLLRHEPWDLALHAAAERAARACEAYGAFGHGAPLSGEIVTATAAPGRHA
jgi:fructoselysine 6-kinase